MSDNVKNHLIAIAIFVFIYILLFLCATAKGQDVKRQGNTFIEQIDSNKTKDKAIETDYLYVDKDGKAYNIYLSKNGKAFINKVSKKSGRKYRKYLPKVTEEICGKKDNL